MKNRELLRMYAGMNLRAEGEGRERTITGVAICFNRESEILYEDEEIRIREMIAPEAVTLELLNRSSILMTLYHDNGRLLARSINGEGNLSYSIEEDGVHFSFPVPDTADGNTAWELVRNGTISGCSFAFRIENPESSVDRTSTKGEDGKLEIMLTIRQIDRIYDFTLTPLPAYPSTECGLRDLAKAHVRESETKQEREVSNSNNNSQNKNQMKDENVQVAETAIENEKEQQFRSMQRVSRIDSATPAAPTSLRNVFRDLSNNGARCTIYLREEGGTVAGANVTLTSDASKGGLLPLTVGEVLNPVQEELIYDKIGIRMPTGCAGQYEWPVVEALKATVAGEAVKVAGQKINLSKEPVVTQRLSIVVEASRESLFNSAGKLEGIIRTQMPLAIADLVNSIILSPTKVTADCAISGPFVGKTATTAEYSFKGFNAAKAKLLAKGYKGARMVWVMTEAQKAELESLPKDAGSGIMTVENDKLAGLPVFCHEAIGEGNVGLGDFTYQVLGQFGDVYLTYDPYSMADANVVRFCLNVDFGTATLDPNAFVLLKAKA